MTTGEYDSELRRPDGELALPCEGSDPDLWFAERLSDVETAKLLCRTCPIRQRCLADALDRVEPWGVSGGEILIQAASPSRPSTWTAA